MSIKVLFLLIPRNGSHSIAGKFLVDVVDWTMVKNGWSTGG